MNIHWIQHVPFEGLGSIEGWAGSHGHRMTSTRVYQGELFPSVNCLDWLIIMGGPMNVYEDKKYPWLVNEKRFIEDTIKAGKIVLGICLGAQLIADVLGAKVYPNTYKEIGWFPVYLTNEGQQFPLFKGLASGAEVFHWHGDTFDLPQGAIQIAQSSACQNQAFIYDERVVGLQFHLETTRQGAEQLIAHCGEELVTAPFIQPREIILSDEGKFQRINQIMQEVLDQLEHI
jgi:GMP synthase-like glutamine amidotransferase